MNRLWMMAVAAGLVCLALGPPVGPAAEQETGQNFVLAAPVVVPLEEVPAFGKEEAAGRVQFRYPRGQSAQCVPTANSEVKAYPTLKSKRPLYGSVKFDGSPSDPAIGTTYHFVLDETGEAEKKPEGGGTGDAKPPADTPKPAGNAEASKPSLLKELARNLAAPPRPTHPFARQAMPAVKPTYDLLYFDRNGDLDLTNDGVIGLTDKPVFEGMPAGQTRGLSGEIEVTFDFGPPLGKRPFPIAVVVYAYQAANDPFSFPSIGGFGIPGGGIQPAAVSFLPKTARRGTVKLGQEQYVAWLSQAMMITGRYDRPYTQLELMRVDRPASPGLLQPGFLGQVQFVGQQLASISTTPLGDKLTIEPYRGDTGFLEIGPGGRAITEMGLAGTLASRTGTPLIGTRLGSYPLPATLPRRYTLPVGDYMLTSVTAQYGRLRFSGRMQTVPAMQTVPVPGSASSAKPSPFLLQIRKDSRSVLEFTGKPEVVFSSPTRDKSFRPGTTVAIRAMLTEPWQNFQITGLWDLTKKERDITYRREGRDIVIPQYARLDPTIAIKNAAGKTVAEGTMPFG